MKFFVSNVAAISGDQTLPLRYPQLPFVASLFWKKFKPDSSDYAPWTDPRVRIVFTVLQTMREFRHGGAIAIVPESASGRILDGLAGYACIEPSTALSEAIRVYNEAREKADAKPEEVSTFESYRDSLAEAVAALSCVDGAVVLSYDLNILGFGMKFEFDSKLSAQTPIELQDPLDHADYRKQIKLNEAGGTRHQSAAQFVLKNHDGIAFVASQDGNITAFVWEEWGDQNQYGSLVAYSRLELTMS